MTDTVDKATRSRMMAGIGSKNTKPELQLRRAIHARGLRFRLHVRDLPGSPDLVFPRYRAAVFVHGCFWHRHRECRFATTPATRPEFWEAKFSANVARDVVAAEALGIQGWRVATVWECALRNLPSATEAAATLDSWLKNGDEGCNSFTNSRIEIAAARNSAEAAREQANEQKSVRCRLV